MELSRCDMDERAQITPVEVVFTLMLTIILMTVVSLVSFPLTDVFIREISAVNLPLSVWGQEMMNTYIGYSVWIFAFPVFFCLLMFVWAFKTIIRKHEYTAQDQYMNDEFY